MMTDPSEFNSSNSVLATPILSGNSRGFEEVDDGTNINSCSRKRQCTDDRIRVYNYSDEEKEVADILFSLATSNGGYYCSSTPEPAVVSAKSSPSISANKEEDKGTDNKIVNPSTTLHLKLPRKTDQQIKSYKCNQCNKVFSSYQELGGHKTSHRIKPTSTAIITEFNSISSPNPSGRLHECSICHKVFNTGQALGGHMRKHYNPVKTAGSTLADGGPFSNSEVTCNTDIYSRPCIDLNLSPSPEEQMPTQTPVLLPFPLLK